MEKILPLPIYSGTIHSMSFQFLTRMDMNIAGIAIGYGGKQELVFVVQNALGQMPIETGMFNLEVVTKIFFIYFIKSIAE